MVAGLLADGLHGVAFCLAVGLLLAIRTDCWLIDGGALVAGSSLVALVLLALLAGGWRLAWRLGWCCLVLACLVLLGVAVGLLSELFGELLGCHRG